MSNQLISFLPSESGSGGCPKAIAPVVNQGALTIAVGTGSALQDLLPAIAAGSPAAFGGQIVNKGCYNVLVTATYLDGDDCDDCTTPDTLTGVPIVFSVPKNSAFPVPSGFITQIQVQALDSAGSPVDLSLIHI